LKELNVFLSDSGYENGNYQRPSNKQKISNADVYFLSIFSTPKVNLLSKMFTDESRTELGIVFSYS